MNVSTSAVVATELSSRESEKRLMQLNCWLIIIIYKQFNC